MPNPIQQPRYPFLLKKMMSLKGPVELSMLEDIFSVCELSSALSPEWAYYRGEFLFSGQASVLATVGQFSWVLLHNPVAATPEANVLAMVGEGFGTPAMGLQIAAGGTTFLATGLDPMPAGVGAPLANKIQGRDSRAEKAGSGLEIRIATTAATPVAGRAAEQYDNGFASIADVQVTVPYILAPGSWILIVPSVVNTPAEVTFYWRERLAGEEGV